MLKWLKKSYEIKICLFINFVMFNKKHWMHIKEYMLSEFLNKVKAIKNLIQSEYNQYKMYCHSEWIIRKEINKYIKLITINEESI